MTEGETEEVTREYDRGEEASGGRKGRVESYKTGYKRGEEASPMGNPESLRSFTEMRRGEGCSPEVVWGRAFEFMSNIAEVGSNLGKLGCCMAWMICQAESSKVSSEKVIPIWGLLAGFGAGPLAVHRSRKKGTFPIRLGELHILWEVLVRSTLDEVIADVHGCFAVYSIAISKLAAGRLKWDAGEAGKSESY